MKKILCALALLSGPLSYIGYLYQNQERFIFEIRTLDKDHRFHFTIPYEELTIQASDLKTPLSAIHFKTKEPKRGIVLFLHGSGTNINEIPQALPEKILDKGYDFYTFDYRGFGKSSGKVTEQDLLNDSMFIYQNLVQQYGEKNVVLYGRSLGTSLATFIASQHSPKHLLLEAPFHSMLDMAVLDQPYLPQTAIENILAFHLRTDLWIPNVKTKVTFAHGDKDDWVPIEEANRLYEKVSSRHKDFTLFKDWGHDHFCDHPEFDDLLDRVLT
ncbi:MAG: alpha/beta hydrolase [Chlamydiae bacterium]|nr:alpha/beta hydrolase [Chlamydiota bacterium]